MQDHKITQISKEDPGVQTYCGRAGTPRAAPPPGDVYSCESAAEAAMETAGCGTSVVRSCRPGVVSAQTEAMWAAKGKAMGTGCSRSVRADADVRCVRGHTRTD